MTRMIAKYARQRGSALLVTLMVIVGLTLLGLGFVAISETESAISVNERNYAQTLNVAEAGAKIVVELFQDPDWGDVRKLLPANNTVFKNERYIDSDDDVSTPLDNVGEYKSTTGSLLFDRPFKSAAVNRFFGTEDYPDVIIDRSTVLGRTYLDDFNAILFADNDHGGRVVEIKVFAPPIVGGIINAEDCWDYGVRYGVATIAVTAEKLDGSGNIAASRQVKMVVAEWPFPGPSGPVQSNASIATGGNLSVHWGKMTSRLNLEVPKPYTAIPWFDAYEQVHFEHGYDSSEEWQATTLLAIGTVIHPTDAAIAATPTLKQFAYQVTAVTTGITDAAEPVWLDGAGGTLTDGGVEYTEVLSKEYPNDPADLYARYNWFNELVGKAWQDPWLEARARGDNVDVTGTAPHPYKYSDPSQDETSAGTAGYSSWFEMQDHSDPPDYYEVIFPRMEYDFWKDVAVTGHGSDGVYYLTWVAGETFSDGLTTKNFAQWTNVDGDGEPGFFFFDTQNKLNPQGTGAAGTLTPDIDVNSADDGANYRAQGFFYVNSEVFGSTGISPPTQNLVAPGEPFRDVGYRKVVESGADEGEFEWSGTDFNVVGESNGDWDWQDLPWSDGDTTPNGEFDVFVASKTITRPGDATTYTGWFPVQYTPGCAPGNNATAGMNCSEPHEPYLNFIYNDEAWDAGNKVNTFQAAWEDPTAETRLPKIVDSNGDIQPSGGCTSSSTPRECTSNRYDRDGSVVTDLDPMIDGVLYIQGEYTSTGNAVYFGSVLVEGDFAKAGTVDVWFDEKLIKGEWPPSHFKFPRVLVTTVRTDE